MSNVTFSTRDTAGYTCCTHLECTDLAGTAQSIYLTSTEKKQIWKARQDSRLFAGEWQILLNTWYCIAVMMGIVGEHRPGWQNSAAGLESRLLGSRSPSTAKPLPGLAVVPQLAHHNQTAQAASEGCVCLLQKGTEAQLIAINTGMLNKQLYFSGIRVQEAEQPIRTCSLPTQPLQCLNTDVGQICHITWQGLTSLLTNFRCGELTLLRALPGTEPDELNQGPTEMVIWTRQLLSPAYISIKNKRGHTASAVFTSCGVD